ncbi:MAG: hypothetical protein HFG00_03575 [Oscillibacter sp.]|nr:hypothetical protein [Oscillibacter sp.]
MEKLKELKELLASLETSAETLRRLIAELEQAERNPAIPPQPFEEAFFLTRNPSGFKGRRPVSVLLPDGQRVITPTWKKVAEAVMKHCNQDQTKHDALMKLRNRIQGRDRVLLSSSVTGMRSPLVIDQGLYLETHYDTESLLRILTGRILDAVGYDYSRIQVTVRSR